MISNALDARRLPDGRVEANDSQDLYWARTAPPPWLDVQEGAERGDLRVREIHIDVGWYDVGFRVDVLAPDWDHVQASYTTSDLDDLVASIEKWMEMITRQGRLPGS
ncbi:hypothetical protein ACWCQZ_50620 [Streptomyces sp. NPDC002285]